MNGAQLLRYAGRRLLGLIPVLLGILLLVFLMVRAIPGSPARNILGQRATPQEIARVEAQLGLDQPVLIQFFRFCSRAVRGDLGKSLRHNVPVTEELKRVVPATIELTVSAFLIAFPAGVCWEVGPLCAREAPPIFSRLRQVSRESPCPFSGWVFS